MFRVGGPQVLVLIPCLMLLLVITPPTLCFLVNTPLATPPTSCFLVNTLLATPRSHCMRCKPSLGIKTTVLKGRCGALLDSRKSCVVMMALAQLSSEADIQTMKASEMKKELTNLGVYHGDCFEKSELQQRLLEARERKQEQSFSTGRLDAQQKSAECPSAAGFADIRGLPGSICAPLQKLSVQDGALGSSVKLDTKEYFAMRVEFPDTAKSIVPFVVDTAAGSTIVTPEFAQMCYAKPTGVSASVVGGMNRNTGLNQVSLGAARIVTLGKEGTEERDNIGVLNAIALQLPFGNSCGGLLGLDLIAKFGLIVFNFAISEAAYFRQESDRDPVVDLLGQQGFRASPLFYLPPPAGLFTVKVRLQSSKQQSVTIPALVDMGAMTSMINWKALESVGLSQSDPEVRATRDVVSGAVSPGQSYDAMLVHEVDLSLLVGGVQGSGGFSMGKHTLNVADLPAFQMMSMSGPAMILGLDILAPDSPGFGGKRQKMFALDIQKRLVWLSPA